jgi:hypothetical protein
LFVTTGGWMIVGARCSGVWPKSRRTLLPVHVDGNVAGGVEVNTTFTGGSFVAAVVKRAIAASALSRSAA